MTLRESHNTISTYLTLTDCREEADETNTKTNTKHQRAFCCKVTTHCRYNESNESI